MHRLFKIKSTYGYTAVRQGAFQHNTTYYYCTHTTTLHIDEYEIEFQRVMPLGSHLNLELSNDDYY